MLKVLICGGRDFDDYSRVCDELDEIERKHGISHVIHGDCAGADKLAGKWAQHSNSQEVRCPANWERHNKAAGPMRNLRMTELKPDLVIAFPGGTGTANMVKTAKAAGIPIRDYR